jgi:hypothetical protein
VAISFLVSLIVHEISALRRAANPQTDPRSKVRRAPLTTDNQSGTDGIPASRSSDVVIRRWKRTE